MDTSKIAERIAAPYIEAAGKLPEELKKNQFTKNDPDNPEIRLCVPYNELRLDDLVEEVPVPPEVLNRTKRHGKHTVSLSRYFKTAYRRIVPATAG